MFNGGDGTFRIGFWPVVCAILVVLIEPAVWTLVGGLAQTILISVVVVGVLTFLTAILSEKVPSYAKPLKSISILLLCALILLAGYAFIFHYQPAQITPTASNSIGAVKDNRGIVTQGQSGGTNIGSQINNYASPGFEAPTFAPEETDEISLDIGTVGLTYPMSAFPYCMPEAIVKSVRQHTPQRLEELWHAMTQGSVITVDGGQVPIGLCISDNNKVLFSVALFSDPQKSPVEVFQNKFLVRPSCWDFNHDKFAFEAVDEHLQPKLQLIYRDPEHILIRGVFIGRNGSVLMLSDEAMTYDPIRPFHIARLFKYPSAKYPSVRQ